MYGLADLAGRGVAVESKAKAALREVIIVSLREDWSIAKLGLLTCLFGQLGNSKILVEFATDELFHEIGVWSEIEPFLVEIAANLHADPKMRLWALDGFVFNNLREGAVEPARSRIDEMLTLVEQRMPATSTHMRVFHYNWALAHFKLGDNTSAVAAASELIEEYYGELGITAGDVIRRNAPELWPLLPQGRDITDMLKHFADTLDLLAQVTGNKGMRTAADRIQAMKFYQLANAFDSLLRVGLNLVDDFVWVNDFICARQVLAFGKVHLAKAAIPLPRSTAHDGLLH